VVTPTVTRLFGSPLRRGIGPAALLAAVVLVLALAGCTSGTGTSTSPTTTAAASGTATATTPPTHAPTTNAQTAAKAAVLAAYRAFWDDVVAVSQTADWRSPRIAAHAAGQAVTALRDSLRQLQQDGLVSHGYMKLDPKVVSLTATTAKVQDCQDITHFLNYDATTGALRDTPSGKRYLADATLTRIDGRWKVTQVAQAVAVCGKA